MDGYDHLPFEVGQVVESRSFKSGYRGAWFRCEIKQISEKNGCFNYLLEYFDFPDEKDRWTKIYQIPPFRKKGEPRIQLMVRPQYPPIYLESLVPPTGSIREVIVVTTSSWSVGDKVDWWTDHCYWSGKLTKLLGNEKAQIELLPWPIGQGELYEVSFKDLRPSLDWSLKDGWSVPTSAVGGESHQCARLILPAIQADGDSSGLQMRLGRTSDSHVEDQLPSTHDFSSCVPMESSAPVDKMTGTSEMLEEPSSLTGRNMNLVPGDNVSENTIVVEKNSSSHGSSGSPKTVGHIVEEDSSNSSFPIKKLRTSGENSLSLKSDTIEATVLALEELLNKIKWLKGHFGGTPNDLQHSWQFVEHLAPSMHE